MTFLVHAYEAIYQGLHGIETIEIIEAMDLNEIHEIATEMSINNVYYGLSELDDEKIKGCSCEQLEEEAYNDIEEFLSKYQKEDIIL